MLFPSLINWPWKEILQSEKNDANPSLMHITTSNIFHCSALDNEFIAEEFPHKL